jgi:hypothetical protein
MESAYEQAARVNDFRAGVLDSLRDPISLRQLIILQEILRRPTENW